MKRIIISMLLFAILAFAFSGCGRSGTASVEDENVATVDGNVQKIYTTFENKYEPIVVQVGIPVEWTINMTNVTGCNAVMNIPEYGVNQKLQEGENTITFTPTQTGEYTYSCWMGMITSSITVVDDISSVDASSTTNFVTTESNNTSGCCNPTVGEV